MLFTCRCVLDHESTDMFTAFHFISSYMRRLLTYKRHISYDWCVTSCSCRVSAVAALSMHFAVIPSYLDPILISASQVSLSLAITCHRCRNANAAKPRRRRCWSHRVHLMTGNLREDHLPATLQFRCTPRIAGGNNGSGDGVVVT